MTDKQRNLIFGGESHAHIIKAATMIMSASVAFDLDEDELLNEFNLRVKATLLEMHKKGIRKDLEGLKALTDSIFKK